MTMICTKSWFLILKHTTLEEKEGSRAFEGAELSPLFPTQAWKDDQRTGDIMARTNDSVEAFTAQYRAQVQI